MQQNDEFEIATMFDIPLYYAHVCFISLTLIQAVRVQVDGSKTANYI